MKQKILSLLMLLLTAASGAWAANPGTYSGLASEIGSGGNIKLAHDYYTYDSGFTITIIISNSVIDGNGAIIDMKGSDLSSVFIIEAAGVTIKNLTIINHTGTDEAILFEEAGKTINVFYNLLTNRTDNTWTFTMEENDVVLTPIYSEATVRRTVEGNPSETAYESLKEALATVQDGDVIMLDWNVKLTETLETPTIEGGVKFTIDFNGYAIDGSALVNISSIIINNAGDELTLIDSSDGQTGGFKGGLRSERGSKLIFAGGRYNIGNMDAENITSLLSDDDSPLALAPGMEFVDLNNGNADTDGFMVRVTHKPFELTIGAGRFATFYADQNVTLAQGTDANVGLYTITKVNDERTTATLSLLTGVVAARTPMLVYNGTGAEQTVTIKVTTDDATTTDIKPIDKFQGTAKEREFTDTDMAAATYFALSGGKAFAQVLEPGTIGANKSWLQFEKSNGGTARSIMLVFEDATGIGHTEITETTEKDNTLYDLNGRKIVHGTSSNGTLRKGVYINDGRKKVVR